MRAGAFLRRAAANLALITAIILYVSGFAALFGPEQTLIGVAAVTGILLFSQVDLALPPAQALAVLLGLFPLIGLVAQIAGVHALIGFFLHFGIVFGLLLCTSRRFAQRSFMPFLLCYVFVQGTPVPRAAFFPRMTALLAAGLCCALAYLPAHRGETPPHDPTPAEEARRFDYAVKMALGLAFSMLLGEFFGLQKGMWMSVTVLSLTQADIAITHLRIRQRVVGTLAGAGVFYLLYQVLLPPSWAVPATFVLAYLYTFVKDYGVQMVFVTISSIAAAEALFSPGTAILTRLALVLAGAGITLLVHFLQPTALLRRCLQRGGT